MTYRVRSALALSVVFGATFAQSKDSASDRAKDLVGRWDAMIRVENGKGLTLQFSDDGTATELWDYERQGTYHLKGTQLSISTMSENQRQLTKRVFEVVQNGKEWTLTESSGGEITLSQVCKGADLAVGIVREWYSDNFPGAVPVIALVVPLRSPVFVEFTKNGEVYFRSGPLDSEKGTYELSAKKLVLKWGSAAPLELKPRISARKIDIRILGENTPELPFRHIEASECGRF